MTTDSWGSSKKNLLKNHFRPEMIFKKNTVMALNAYFCERNLLASLQLWLNAPVVNRSELERLLNG